MLTDTFNFWTVQKHSKQSDREVLYIGTPIMNPSQEISDFWGKSSQKHYKLQ